MIIVTVQVTAKMIASRCHEANACPVLEGLKTAGVQAAFVTHHYWRDVWGEKHDLPLNVTKWIAHYDQTARYPDLPKAEPFQFVLELEPRLMRKGVEC